MFQPDEPVTVCDQFPFFFRRETEGEVFGEPFRVSLYGLIERPRSDVVDLRQVSIYHHPMSTDGQDPVCHSFHRYGHRSVLPGRMVSIRSIACTVPPGPETRTPPEGGVPA